MSTNGQTTERRLQALERAYAATNHSHCTTCWGHGSITIGIPEDAASDDPRYTPDACLEYGTPLHRIMHLVGMTDDELP